MEEVRIDTEYIKLDQFLKLINICQSGGEAKFIIKSGNVKVNNELVYERKKKIRKGDKVSIEGDNVYIVV